MNGYDQNGTKTLDEKAEAWLQSIEVGAKTLGHTTNGAINRQTGQIIIIKHHWGVVGGSPEYYEYVLNGVIVDRASILHVLKGSPLDG